MHIELYLPQPKNIHYKQGDHYIIYYIQELTICKISLDLAMLLFPLLKLMSKYPSTFLREG